MRTATENTQRASAQEAFPGDLRNRIGQLGGPEAREALGAVLNDRDRQVAARLAAEQERDAAREQLQTLEETALNAGGIGVVQERRDGRLIVTIGRSEAVLGIAEADIEFNAGDRVRTDMGRAIAVENLGPDGGRACDIAQIVSTLDGNRALVKINGKERVHTLAHALRNGRREELKPGASVIVDDDANIIYCIYSTTETRDYAQEIPEVVFVSNPGLEKIEKYMIRPLLAGPKKRKAGMCVILTGPAGGGKTNLLISACQRNGVKLIRITSDTVSSGVVSETGRAVDDVFSRAIEEARKGTPIIVAIEEANTLVSRRYGYHHRSAASQEFANISSSVILALDRLVHLGPELPIEVVLTSNALSEIDPTVRSRSTERRIGFIDRDFGGRILRAHLQSDQVQLSGGDDDAERLVDMLFDNATAMVQVEAEVGQTRERFRLFPGQLVLPRLVAGLSGDLKMHDQPVGWEDAAEATHARLLSHANQVADSPEHYVSNCSHPFAGDADLKIKEAVSVYPTDLPRDFLLQQ